MKERFCWRKNSRFISMPIDWIEFRKRFSRIYKIFCKFINYFDGFLHVERNYRRWKSMIGEEWLIDKEERDLDLFFRDLFIENLLQQQFQTRIGNQSLLEQILVDRVPQEQVILNADNWFEIILNSVNNLFSLLYVCRVSRSINELLSFL